MCSKNSHPHPHRTEHGAVPLWGCTPTSFKDCGGSTMFLWPRLSHREPAAAAASAPIRSLSAQRLRAAGRGAAGPVLQARRADRHETAHLRAEKLEQFHLPLAGRRGQAPGLHRSHLQPDAADRHVDGEAANEEEPWPQGVCGPTGISDPWEPVLSAGLS